MEEASESDGRWLGNKEPKHRGSLSLRSSLSTKEHRSHRGIFISQPVADQLCTLAIVPKDS